MNVKAASSLAALGLLVGAFLILNDQAGVEDSGSTGPEIRIGWIGTVSEGQRKYFHDQESLNAVLLAVESYNRRVTSSFRVKLLVEGIDEDASGIQSTYENMVSQNIKVLLVNHYEGTILLAERAKQDDIILVNSAHNDHHLESLNENVFLIGKRTEDLSGLIADDIIYRELSKILFVYSEQDNFMKRIAEETEDVCMKTGLQCAFKPYQVLPDNFLDLVPESELRQFHSFAFLGGDETGHAMKAVKEIFPFAPIYSVGVSEKLIQNAGKATAGLFYVGFTASDANREMTKEFTVRYFTKFKSYPAMFWKTLQAYDAINIILYSLNTVESGEGKLTDGLKTRLSSIENFNGVTGFITMLPEGSSRGVYWNLYQLAN